jgi:RNA recognition motif-containing protein
MSMKLFVGNLSFKMSTEQLKSLFEQVGEVESATIVEDRESGRSRGFGFVEMASEEDGLKAIEEFNGKDFDGRTLTVNEAKQREERRGGGREGGRGGRGGGGGGFGSRGGGGGGGAGGGYGGGRPRRG